MMFPRFCESRTWSQDLRSILRLSKPPTLILVNRGQTRFRIVMGTDLQSCVRRTVALLAISTLGTGLSVSTTDGDVGYQTGSTSAKSPEGKQAFVARCGICHGLDGRGGEHAPAIATGAAVQLSDADVERILQSGIPSKGMPSF